MAQQISNNQDTWHVQLKECSAPPVDEAFLDKLVAELDNDAVRAIILRGSYARGDASSYSDLDFTRFVKEPPAALQARRFTYREGRLISVSTRTLDQERKRLAAPEEAVFVVEGLREARILLDKDGAFEALQQEARAFSWEPLQAAANAYASRQLMLHTEYVHKILRALLLHDEFALSEIALELLFILTDVVVVQRGILIRSGNTYFRQAEEAIGRDSAWTHYHRLVAGIKDDSSQAITNEIRGVAVLRLYQETVKLLRSILSPEHRDVVEESMVVIDRALADEQVS
jgi:predicted nucleotidyltransferase